MSKSAFGGGFSKQTTIEFEIAENGEILFKTGDLTGANHASADEFLKAVKRVAGGEVRTTKVKRGVVHDHAHVHDQVKTRG